MVSLPYENTLTLNNSMEYVGPISSYAYLKSAEVSVIYIYPNLEKTLSV